LCFSSSGGTVYGKLRETPVRETHPVSPITAYGAGKATTELYLNFYRAMHGMDCRIARIANHYGASQDLTRGLGTVIAFLYKALTGQPIPDNPHVLSWTGKPKPCRCARGSHEVRRVAG
jgi:UDP-glucose 4-epimerase